MVRYHIHPWNWCHVIACGRYDVLAAIRCESTNAVEENQVTLCFFGRRPIRLALLLLGRRPIRLTLLLLGRRPIGLALLLLGLRPIGLALRAGADSNGETDLAELFYK